MEGVEGCTDKNPRGPGLSFRVSWQAEWENRGTKGDCRVAESVARAHACAPERNLSETAAGILALSTAGNDLGALLTTFLLPGLGTASASVHLVVGLFLAAALASFRSVPAAVAVFPTLDLWVEATHCVERNPVADYRIVEFRDGGRMFVLGAAGMTLGKGLTARRTSASLASIPPNSGSPGSAFRCRRAGSRPMAPALGCGWRPGVAVLEPADMAGQRAVQDPRRPRAALGLLGLLSVVRWHRAGPRLASSDLGAGLFRCRQSEFDGDSAIYSDAVPRACQLPRSLPASSRGHGSPGLEAASKKRDQSSPNGTSTA